MDVQLPPLRSFDDFLLGARFQAPSLNDQRRLSNRIINNLLYYQTNYIISAVLVFFMVGFYRPVHMITGILIAAGCFVSFVNFTNNRSDLRRLKSKHPIVAVLSIGLVTYLITKLIGAVFVFFVGLFTPVVLTVLHSSLRLRNVNNKISRFKEYIGLKRTPMGVLLEGLGQEQEAGS